MHSMPKRAEQTKSSPVMIEFTTKQQATLQRDFLKQSERSAVTLMEGENVLNPLKKDKAELRPYEWTFRQPVEVQIDYNNFRGLTSKAKETEELLILEQKNAIKKQTIPQKAKSSKKQQTIQQAQSEQKQELPYFRVSEKIQTANTFQSHIIAQVAVEEEEIKYPTKRNSKIMVLDNSKDKDFAILNLEAPNVYESDVFLQTEDFQYRPDIAGVCGTPYLIFTSLKLGLSDISKIKIFPSTAKGRSFKIKIEHCKKNYFMGVQLKRELYNLPEHYIWFAKIVNSKLMRDKMFYELIMQSSKAIKNQPGPSDGTFIQGEIYKKSKYKKKWEKRYIVINTQGLFSYKSRNQNYTFIISSKDLEELWTRFEPYDGNLIIKILHSGIKTQFAIPIMDYCPKTSQNWLFAFYRLLMEHKIHIKTL